MKIIFDFGLGDYVIIDGDTDLVACVDGVRYLGRNEYLLSWLHNGSEENGWFAENRLQKAQDKTKHE